MGVQYKTSGAQPAVSAFEDDFNRANGIIGFNYFVGTTIVSNWTIGGNQMIHNSTGVSGQDCFICLGAPGLQGSRSQFMQIDWISGDPGAIVGPALYLAGQPNIGVAASQMQGYCLILNTGASDLIAIRPGASYTSLSLIAVALGAGARMGIQVDIGSASNRIRTWKNGVLERDITDSNAARATATGLPGCYTTGGGGLNNTTFDNLEIRKTR